MIDNVKNKFCMDCLKSNVCTWYQQLAKLNSTEKKDVPLAITINECEEYLGEVESEEE